MLRCPRCRRTADRFTYSGWVIKAIGTVAFGEDGLVKVVGPTRATSVVKEQREITSPRVMLTCPHCGTEEVAKLYEKVLLSWLSGADATLMRSVGGFNLSIAADEVELFISMITPQSIQAETDSSVLTDLFN